MRLLTHNLLQCHVKGCNENNFPLRLEHTEIHVARPPTITNPNADDSGDKNASDSGSDDEGRVEYNRDFIVNFLPKLDYPALRTALMQLGVLESDPIMAGMPADLPDNYPNGADGDEYLLKSIHRALMETRIIQGEMVCNGCGHVYPIRDGIPNMLLQEDEV